MIVIEKLAKAYGAVRAIDGLDLAVNQGEIFGFLGPNGAGKTTTVRVLTTLTRPDTGRALIDGCDVVTQRLEVKRRFGVVQQHLSMDRELNVAETMEMHARIRGMKAEAYRPRIGELLEYVELGGVTRQTVEDLSGGMKRRLQIARALLHRPELLMLDEPTVGLDAQTRRRIWELIRGLNNEGVTVFLTTHYIEEAEAVCDRVGIIDHGRLISLGTPTELRARLGKVVVESVSNGQTQYRYFPDHGAARAYAQQLPETAKTITVRRSNLEDVFIELTGRKVND